MVNVAPMTPHPRKLASIRHLTGFWREVLDRNRVSSLPDALEKLSRQGRLDNFRIAAVFHSGTSQMRVRCHFS